MCFFKQQLRAFLLAAVLAAGAACLPGGALMAQSAGGQAASGGGTFTDSRNGKTYKTATIGGKTWMAENLNFEVPEKSWCYGDSVGSCNKYGRLYNWGAAEKVCPAGWHLPSAAEWDSLAAAAGGIVAGQKLKASSGWMPRGAWGTDDFGFKALPGGSRTPGGDFSEAGEVGSWWTSTHKKFEVAGREMRKGGQRERKIIDEVTERLCSASWGFSVRCVQD